MILGIGIDVTEIERFKNWHTYSKTRLLKIFSEEEIDYCLGAPRKSAERFAVRFAAKEAFLKALSNAGLRRYGLLTICKAVRVVSNDEMPHLVVGWGDLELTPLKTHFSLSHTSASAFATVVLEKLT